MIETVVMLVHMYNVLALIIPWGVAKKNGTDPTPKIPAMIFALISTIAMMVALSPVSWLFYAVLASTIAITLWINRDGHNWADRQLIMKDFYQLQESIAKYVEDGKYLPMSLRFLDLYYDIQHGDNSTDQLDKKIRELKVLWLDRWDVWDKEPQLSKDVVTTKLSIGTRPKPCSSRLRIFHPPDRCISGERIGPGNSLLSSNEKEFDSTSRGVLG